MPPASPALASRYDAALDACAEAGQLALALQGGGATLKGAQDWLTEADGAVERFLSDRLAQLFPADGFQGEEGGTARGGTLRWVADPIDGTSNYAHGGTRWCISLGLLEGARPLLGVLAAPGLGETYAAYPSSGVLLNGKPARAAQTAELSRAIVECGWSPRRATADYLALCTRVMATGAMLRSGGSGALGLAEVAAGRLDGYAELHINLWDIAGALALLAESGAVTHSFLDDGALTQSGPILAAAPGIAAALQAAAAL